MKTRAYGIIQVIFFLIIFFVRCSSPADPVPMYSIVYDGNGNTGGTVPFDGTKYQTGHTIPIPSNSGNLVKVGLKFTGWNTKTNASGTTYTAGQNYTMGSADVTLYARWTSNPTYTITYFGNGNNGGDVPLDNTEYEVGHSITAMGNTQGLVKTGYNFNGWNTRADATGTNYQPGDSFPIGAANVSLYAKWSANPAQLDVSFDPGTGPNGDVNNIIALTNGKILIAGGFTSYRGVANNHVARLNADGTLDGTFHLGTGTIYDLQTLVIQPDQKIFIAGAFTAYDGVDRTNIVRLNSDGTVDSSFDPGRSVNDTIYQIVVQPGGEILIAGAFTNYRGTSRIGLARLQSGGALDPTFNAGVTVNDIVICLALQPDGKILIGGLIDNYAGTGRNSIVRLNANGSLDTTFNPGTGVNGYVNNIIVLPDGKLLIGGSFSQYNGSGRRSVARLNADGTLDTTFDPKNGLGSNELIRMVRQGDGKILIGGYFWYFDNSTRHSIVRLNSDGSVDTGWDPGTAVESGGNDTVIGLALQADGKILLGGIFTFYNGTPRNRIARVWP